MKCIIMAPTFGRGAWLAAPRPTRWNLTLSHPHCASDSGHGLSLQGKRPILRRLGLLGDPSQFLWILGLLGDRSQYRGAAMTSMPQGTAVDFDRLVSTFVEPVPFPFLIVPQFVVPEARREIGRDFP